MKKIISKLGYFTFDVVAIIFSLVIVWLIISTIEVSFYSPQYIKENRFNLFVFSQSQKDSNHSNVEIITEDDIIEDDEEDDQIINC